MPHHRKLLTKEEMKTEKSVRSLVGIVALLLLSSVETLALPSPPSRTTPRSPPTDSELLPIVVVGAGLAGLSLAVGLADVSERPVHVLESYRAFADRAGATLRVAPCGLKALRELCPAAHDKIALQGLPPPFFGGYMLPWYAVRDALLEQVRKRSDQITLHMGSKFEIDENSNDSSCVRVVYSDNSQEQEGADPSQEKEIKACLLVGCDGVHSQVRNYLGLPKSSRVQNAWRGTITPPNNLTRVAALLNQGFDPIGTRKLGPFSIALFNFHPATPRTIAWTVLGDVPQLPAKSNVWELLEPYLEEGEEKEVLREVMELSNESDLRNVLEYGTIDPRAAAAALSPKSGIGGTGWGGRGRITLSGDSAHCLRPTTGIGASMAFEDSVVLCRTIRTALNDESENDIDWGAVVQTFEMSRMERVVRVWDEEWSFAEHFRKTGGPKPVSKEYSQWLDAGV